MSFFQKILNRILNRVNGINSIRGNVKIDRSAYVYGSKIIGNVTISENVKIHLAHIQGKVEIGKYTSLWGPNVDIYSAINEVRIGNFCSIARNTSFQEYAHKSFDFTTYNYHRNLLTNSTGERDEISKGSIIIEHDVWIGTHCVILGGAFISTGAIVAANSVVTGFVPPYAIVAGSPAKVVKFRFEKEIIEKLLATEWWNWPVDRIRNEYKGLQNIVGLKQ